MQKSLLQKLFTVVIVITIIGIGSCKEAGANESNKVKELKEVPLQPLVNNLRVDSIQKPSCCKGVPSRQKLCVKN